MTTGNSEMPSDQVEMISSTMAILDQLTIGAALFDGEDRCLAWNSAFIQFFPEHADFVHVGEHYRENLYRFYTARLDADEASHIDRYIEDGIARHQRQSWPFEFCHRGQWLRVASLPIKDLGRMRIWMPIAPAQDGETLARVMATSGKEPVIGSIDSIVDGLMARNADGTILFVNQRFASLYGLPSEALAVGKSFLDVLTRLWEGLPGKQEALLALQDNARFAGAPFELPLPRDRWVRISEYRAANGSGISTHVDVTDLYRLQRNAKLAQERAETFATSLQEQIDERKRVEGEPRSSEQRLLRILDCLPTPLVCTKPGTNADAWFVNKQFVRCFGYTLEDIPNLGVWARRAYPDGDRRSDLVVPWEVEMQQLLARHGKVAAFEARVRCKDGQVVDVLISAESLDDMTLVSFVDISARKRAEEQQMLLAREVDHRAKNALAVVQAALRLTPKADAVTFARAVEGRVTALARAHNLLAKDGWRGAELRSLLSGELAPFVGRSGPSPADRDVASGAPRLEMDGPSLALPLEMVQPLAMVVHELATNAVKYGALSVPDGLVRISWELVQIGEEKARSLRLQWEEFQGPMIGELPSRSGFGSRVIMSTIERQLCGQVHLDWAPAGLRCCMIVPAHKILHSEPV